MVSDKTEEKMQRGTCGNDGLYSTHDEHGIAQKTNSHYHTHSLSLAIAWQGKARTITITNNQQESQQITDTLYEKEGADMLAATISLIYQKCDKKKSFPTFINTSCTIKKTPPAMFLSPSKNISCFF